MRGGSLDDLYLVDDINDTIIELASGGMDTVKSTISFSLPDNIENLTLIGDGAEGIGNDVSNKITGNAAANVLIGLGGADNLRGMAGNDTIYGGAGADKLDGGFGADSMYGGADNDTYTVDDAGDQVIESAGEGTDTVSASVSFTVSENVENLTLTGTSAIDGAGNMLDNKLTGNAAANVLTGGDGADALKGMDGNDTLYGDAGKDKLDGGRGADSMHGGAANDSYVVDNAGDQVFENVAEGTDSVSASVSFVLSANVENLTLTGSSAIDATGNELGNRIKGNADSNVLTGGLGKDSLTGGGGADTFVFGAALAASVDKVTDFEHGLDHLAFHSADYGLPVGSLDPGNLAFGSQATASHAQFVYDDAHQSLLWDADGIGGVRAELVATLAAGVVLSSSDFQVIA